MKIYCPLCAYEPRPHDRWVCQPGCGTIWNTFETGGRCPGCQRRWADTCCPACLRWSPHEDWYHDDALDEAEADAEAEMVEVGSGEWGVGSGRDSGLGR
jgi:hypothetical protein